MRLPLQKQFREDFGRPVHRGNHDSVLGVGLAHRSITTQRQRRKASGVSQLARRVLINRHRVLEPIPSGIARRTQPGHLTLVLSPLIWMG